MLQQGQASRYKYQAVVIVWPKGWFGVCYRKHSTSRKHLHLYYRIQVTRRYKVGSGLLKVKSWPLEKGQTSVFEYTLTLQYSDDCVVLPPTLTFPDTRFPCVTTLLWANQVNVGNKRRHIILINHLFQRNPAWDQSSSMAKPSIY